MNSKTTIVGLVAAIAVLSGAMGLSVTGAFSDLKPMTSNAATGFLIGHVEIEATNANGELFAYRQSDNAVVDDGEQCILKMLFGTTGGLVSGATEQGRGEYLATTSDGSISDTVGACTGILTGAWDIIAIGEGTTTPADTDVKLQTEFTTATGAGLDRAYATTKTWTNGTGATTTKIVLKNTFTSTSGSTESITESGLFNSTTVAGSGMLAHQTFTAVSLTSGDSITVQWTFTVGD